MKKNLAGLAVFALSLLIFNFSKAEVSSKFNLNAMSASDIINSGEKDADAFKLSEPAPTAPKEWTMMVFMNAKNNLSESLLYGLSGKWAQKDLKEMKEVGTTGKVNVVLEYGITGQGAKRMLVGKKSETVLKHDLNADMGDYKRVIEFVKWSKTNFPAKRYMLVLWNHGLGWIDPNLNNAGATGVYNRAILFDDETKNYVRTRELGEILRQTGYVDVFVMNACLMQMAEVAYEIKDNTGLIVGSEEVMLAYGFDYTKLLSYLNANTETTYDQLSDFFINWEKEFFATGANLIGPINIPLSSIPATLSTIRPQALNGLPAYLNAFASAAMKYRETEAVKWAIENTVRFSSLDIKNDKEKLIAPYVDLYDFARIVSDVAGYETQTAAEKLMSYIKTKLVIRSVGLNKDLINGYDYTRVGGIAIGMTMKAKQLPPQLGNIYETNYSDLSLSQSSLWDEFVAWCDATWRN
ncbi:MAG: clostripain-related cysteine peptidase [Elusimicrobia bacterium]|nr:clostripain-related cysteine peptidase [Elusimicrobiota bacterium]